MKQNIYDNDCFFQQYQQIRARQNNYNRLLEQPHFIAQLPALHGKAVLDIGCGAGDFAAHCVQYGAIYVTGVDISANMIELAIKRHTHEKLHFKRVAFEEMTVQDESFDVITSSLAFHYIEDFEALIEKISGALRVGGTLLFSTEHPIETANKGHRNWIQDEEGSIEHFAINRYQHEGKRTQNWLVDGVVMYHRTLATMMNTLIACGLQIEAVIEPLPSEEAIRMHPSLQKEFCRPSFLIVKATKCHIKGDF